jgi:hypothetical protein
MKTNVKSEDYGRRFTCNPSKKDPVECITEERDLEDWWERRAGGWNPDQIGV